MVEEINLSSICVFIIEKGINNLQYEILPSDSEPTTGEGLNPMFGTCMGTLEGFLYMSRNYKYCHE